LLEGNEDRFEANNGPWKNMLLCVLSLQRINIVFKYRS
jgi:hypothetical protein